MQTTPAAVSLVQFVTSVLPGHAQRPLIVGLCGAQGSGKSTACEQLISMLAAKGHRAAALALDDLYLPAQARERLAKNVHPLLNTRGVPGTHDIQLGLGVLQSVQRGHSVAVPRFDKARDDRTPPQLWHPIEASLDVLLFEGWCVGARPQDPQSLIEPVNELERIHDADCRWRSYVNERLGSDYQELFGYLDALVLLAAPGFEIVAAWRKQQEHALRARLLLEGGDTSRVMTDAQINTFVQHYERLTRHILDEMPSRADVTIRLSVDREID
jgi:D-glycerate 3-kinase